MKYFRLDYPNVSPEEQVNRINTYLKNKFPVICGFYCFESLDHPETGATGEIPYPHSNEANIGGHAILIYGYDKNKVIRNPLDGSETKGAWLFRNSWSWDWGSGGNGYLPFDYLTKRHANDPSFLLADEFYTVTKTEWLEAWRLIENV